MSKKSNDLQQAKAYQDSILAEVSRTFALTIPQLPPMLRCIVANGYLLCRIVDTIEDDHGLTPNEKQYFHAEFEKVLMQQACADDFSAMLYPKLSEKLLAAERDLIQHIPQVIQITLSFTAKQQAILQRHVRIMCHGMAQFESQASRNGLASLEAMNQYCYYVAGIVGEMLTELFCDHSPAIASVKPQLSPLAVSFGQGLQMTNILKDIWDDHARGVLWLPRDVFARYGYDLSQLDSKNLNQAYVQALKALVRIAYQHVSNALNYTLLIPKKESGIRRFCLWALIMAAMTLRNIYNNPLFSDKIDVKITRREVKLIMATSSTLNFSNHLERRYFQHVSGRLSCMKKDNHLEPCIEG